MSNNIENELRVTVAKILEVDVEVIQHDSSSDTLESWDSLKHMSIIVEIEKKYGIQFLDDDIEKVLSFDSLLARVEELLNS